MTPDQITLVQQSFHSVLAIREQAAMLFYTRLFEIEPPLRRLFGSDIKGQGAKLMAAIATVVRALDRPETIIEGVRALARRHLRYGVTERDYATVGAALLWTLEHGLGKAFTAELRAAWTAAYAMLSGAMIEAAREALAMEMPIVCQPSVRRPAMMDRPASFAAARGGRPVPMRAGVGVGWRASSFR